MFNMTKLIKCKNCSSFQPYEESDQGWCDVYEEPRRKDTKLPCDKGVEKIPC